MISEHAVVAVVGDIHVTRIVHRYVGVVNHAAVKRRVEAVGHDPVVVSIVAHETAALSEHGDSSETPRKRSCIGEYEGAAVDLIHGVEIFIGVNCDALPSERIAKIEALSTRKLAGAVVGREVTGAIGPAATGAEGLIGDGIARAS